MYMPDGSPISSSVPTSEKRGQREASESVKIHRGIVLRTVYPEDEKNSNGQRIEYVVKIDGQIYDNAILASDIGGGGIYNYKTTVLKSSEKSFSDEMSDATFDENLDGEFVYCQFLRGMSDIPIIVSGDTHPKHSLYKSPTAEEGVFDVKEFNGMEFKTDKDGNYTIRNVGIKDPEGVVNAPEGQGSILTMGVDGSFSYDAYGAIPVASPEEKEEEPEENFNLNFKLTKLEGDNSFELNVNDNKLLINKDGIVLEDVNGNTITIDGDGKNITDQHGNTVIMNGDGIKIESASKLFVGGAGAELVDSLSQTLEQLINHTHPTGVGPSGPPIEGPVMQPIKQAVDGIKM